MSSIKGCSLIAGAWLGISLTTPGLAAELAADNVALSLPEGFSATLVHEGVGPRARHIVVRDNGDIFVSMRDGELVALRDRDGDGRAERIERRKLAIKTGLALKPPYLYFSDNLSVSRIRLDDYLMPSGEPEIIVSGFPEQGSHADKTIALNDADELYVNVGAPSNACQEKSRSPESPGQDPCPQLERQAAIWKYHASTPGQTQLGGKRFVTGTRNVIALDWHPADQALYFVMHGRDQLSTLWPDFYDDEDSAEQPAEEFHRAQEGGNYGWPFTYVDPATHRRLLAPEYGGDGEQEAEGGKFQTPLHGFPAHWAPNDLVFYTGEQFPERYHGGAFIAWHGSWNRAPRPQDGYRVTFVPFADGALTAEPEDFVTGFKGSDTLRRPSNAAARPGGLAVGPDGSLFVTESIEGRIWRISHGG